MPHRNLYGITGELVALLQLSAGLWRLDALPLGARTIVFAPKLSDLASMVSALRTSCNDRLFHQLVGAGCVQQRMATLSSGLSAAVKTRVIDLLTADLAMNNFLLLMSTNVVSCGVCVIYRCCNTLCLCA